MSLTNLVTKIWDFYKYQRETEMKRLKFSFEMFFSQMEGSPIFEFEKNSIGKTSTNKNRQKRYTLKMKIKNLG